MSETALLATPYKGLMPYSEEDAPFFFGREPERQIITANLRASRLTLLYGTSGVGKSSVLRAGVAHHLRQLAQRNLAKRGTPRFAVVVFSSWRDDPIAGLADRVQDSVAQALNVQTLEPVPPSRTLAQTLQAWTERVAGDLFIILDQFEQYFLYHPQEDGEGIFAVEFPRAVNSPDLRVSFLVSIREDSLAKLDRFKGRIPNLFDNYLRIEHLDREAARAAIEKPVEQYNLLRKTDVRVEPTLVEAVLDQVRTGQVVLGEAGRGVVRANTRPASAEVRIETPYLQLVMTRLWDEEMRAGSRALRLETLERLGGAEQIVKTHLDAAMSSLPTGEQDAAARVFHHLVTPSGTKIAHTVSDLAEYADLAETQVAPVLDKLSDPGIRIVRPVAPPPDRPAAPRYEIFHDVLAPAILKWREQYVQARELEKAEERAAKKTAAREREAARQRDLKRLRSWLVGLFLLIMVMVVLAVVAIRQSDAATRAQKTAVVAQATAETNEQLAATRAAEAVAAQSTAEAEANARATEVVVRTTAEAEAVAAQSTAEVAMAMEKTAMQEAWQSQAMATAVAAELSESYLYRGFINTKLDDQKQAITDYTKAIEVDPDYAVAYFYRGLAYADLDKYGQAITDYTKAIELDSDYVFAYLYRGFVYVDLGEYKQAITDYTKAIELDPNYAVAYYFRGLAYANLGEYDQAITDYTKTIELDPDYALAYDGRGFARNELKEYALAISDFTRAIELDPDLAFAYSNRGWAYSQLGDYTQAFQDFEKSVELNPNNPWVYYYRGLTYANLGNREAAVTDLEMALQLSEPPLDENRLSIAKAMLQRLRPPTTTATPTPTTTATSTRTPKPTSTVIPSGTPPPTHTPTSTPTEGPTETPTPTLTPSLTPTPTPAPPQPPTPEPTPIRPTPESPPTRVPEPTPIRPTPEPTPTALQHLLPP